MFENFLFYCRDHCLEPFYTRRNKAREEKTCNFSSFTNFEDGNDSSTITTTTTSITTTEITTTTSLSTTMSKTTLTTKITTQITTLTTTTKTTGTTTTTTTTKTTTKETTTTTTTKTTTTKSHKACPFTSICPSKKPFISFVKAKIQTTCSKR